MGSEKIRIGKILLAFDNSDMSFMASETALTLAGSFGAEVVGVHAYNAVMHEGAFRIMEPTLPVQYQKDEILQKQRGLHTGFINYGMEKISLSYLRPVEEAFRAAEVSFRPMVREGKNFRVVNDILAEEGGDLTVIGASGFNTDNSGFIGSVCLRVLRKSDMNFLVVRKQMKPENMKFVVALDGSAASIDALRMAKTFAGKYNSEIHLVYVFDSKLHREIFERLKESVISKEGFSFNSREQEKMHDRFIDKGLARVGEMIHKKAEQDVFNGDINIVKNRVVLEGEIYKGVCDYAAGVKADIVFVGKTGRHFAEGIDIGSTAENVVRYAPCNVFVARHKEYKGWEL